MTRRKRRIKELTPKEQTEYQKWLKGLDKIHPHFSWGTPVVEQKSVNRLEYTLKAPPGREVEYNHKSKQTPGGSTALKEVPVYTGDLMIGIGTLHKSNGVPIFRAEDAQDLARMRR